MEEAIRKSKVLIEALPYIKKFFNKVIVIKYGGSYLHDREVRNRVLQDMVFMRYAGMKQVLVNGGGPDISRRLKEENVETRFVDGLRVTCEKSIEVVDSVLEEINGELVEEMKSFGVEAFGLSGKENNMIRTGRREASSDLGYVGTIESIDTTILDKLLSANVIPIISPVGKGRDSRVYNINADEAASNLAIALSAEKFVLMTNVMGVMRNKDKNDTLFHSLSFEAVKRLMTDGIIAEGMKPKVNACLAALKDGVKKAHIVNASLPHALLLEIFTDKGIGTEIVKG